MAARLLHIKIFLTCLLLVTGAKAEPHYHASLMGPMGLTLMPNARMDEPGTVSATLGTLDPYIHGNLGVQIARPLYIGLRQSSEVSSLNNSKDRLYPGVDVKLRLVAEGPYHPELSIGLQNALGHKRMAGEYLVASKRFENWDVSAGLGWGRYGSAHQIGNPLGILGSHFKKNRDIDGQDPNGPSDWFTDQDIGLFAGIEYSTPWVKNLSLSAEWGADRYLPETAAFDYNKPAPWALGVHYSPRPWLNMTAAWVGGEKVLAALTFKEKIAAWPGRLFKKDKPQTIASAALPTDSAGTRQIEIPSHLSTPQAIGYILHHDQNVQADTNVYDIQTLAHGLQGPLIRLNRRTTDNSLGKKVGSPQEVWHDTIFNPENTQTQETPSTGLYGLDTQIILDQQISLAEEDQGILYRTGVLAKLRATTPYGLLGGMGLRLNLADNLDSLDQYRTRPAKSVRSDISDYTEDHIGIDQLYIGMAHSIAPSWYAAAAAGYLEEMYAGIGGDILYRPFSSRWALGLEGWYVRKRDTDKTLHAGLTGDHSFTGHLKAYYEFAERDMTAEARLGRYLDGDMGVTLALTQRFAHGLSLRGFTTVTNEDERDVFGGKTNLYSGIEVNLPLGHFKSLPQNSTARVRAAPFGRDKGQMLDNPVDLYALSEPLSYRHISQYWSDIGPE